MAHAGLAAQFGLTTHNFHQVGDEKDPVARAKAAVAKQAKAKAKKEAEARAKLAERAKDKNIDPYADSSDDNDTADA